MTDVLGGPVAAREVHVARSCIIGVPLLPQAQEAVTVLKES